MFDEFHGLTDRELAVAHLELQRLSDDAMFARRDVRGTRSRINQLLRDLEQETRSDARVCELEIVDRFTTSALAVTQTAAG